MARFAPGNLGQTMQRAGAALGNLGQTVFDIEAEEQFRTGRLALVSSLEKFKQSLWQDPDYGTPGQGDGYVGKFQEFMQGTKGQPGAVGATISGLSNVMAQGKLDEYAKQLELEQGAEIEELQFKKWAVGTVAKSDKRILTLADSLSGQQFFDAMADELETQRGHNLIDEPEYERKAYEFSQVAIKKGLKKGALAAMDSAADPFEGYAAAMKYIGENSESFTAGGGTFTAGEQVREAVSTDVKAEYAMREAAFQKRGEEFLSSYQTQLDTDPESIISDVSAELAKIEGQNIPKAAKDKATMALWNHNGDALYSYSSNRISSAQTLGDLTGTLQFLQDSGALWQGKRQEQDRASLISQVRGLIAERERAGAGGDDKDVKKATYGMKILNAKESVLRKDMPSEELKRGARVEIMGYGWEAASLGIDISSDINSALKELGVITPKVAASLDAYEAMYLKAVFPGDKAPDKKKLSIQQNQELVNFTDTILRMGDEGTKRQEEIDAYIEGALRDQTIGAFKAMREDKLGGTTLTTDTMLDAVGLIQSGKLANQMPVVAGRRMVNPTIDANVKKAEDYMGGEIVKLGFTDITPKPQPDGSYEFAAKRPGLAQPYRLKPQIDQETGKMVLQEYIQSRKAWETWKNPATGAAVQITPKAEAPQEKDREEIKKIVSTGGDDPAMIANQFVNAILGGRLNLRSVLTAGPTLGKFADLLPQLVSEEYERRTQQ
jgi:hypothetical protein